MTVPRDFVVLKASTQNIGTTFTDPTNQMHLRHDSNDAMLALKGAEFAIYNANPSTDANATVVKTLTQAAATDGYYWSVGDLMFTPTGWSSQGPRRTPSCPSPSVQATTARAGSSRNDQFEQNIQPT